MKRSTADNTATRVYLYGAVPVQPFPEAGVQDLFKANKLWNSLVEIHNKHRAQYESARRDADAEYALISESVDQIEQEVEKAYDDKRTARMKAGTKDASHPLIQEANAVIAQLKQRRRELWESAKAARKRADALIDKKALNDAFRDAVNAAQRVENTGGLHSKTANLIADNFRTARERAFKEGARLNFHRFDGTGYWFFRFQSGRTKVDGVDFKELFSTDKTDGRSFILQPAHREREKPRLPLRVKVSGGVKLDTKVYAYFDMILHRPLPDGAQVQNAKLVRNRVGDRFKYTVNFTVREPQAQASEVKGEALGVDIGFRQLKDGGIRAAAIGGSAPDDGVRYVEVPEDLISRLDYIDQLKGQLDKSAAALGEHIKPLLKAGTVLPKDHPKYKLVRSIAAAPPNVTMSFEKAYKLAGLVHREPGLLPAIVESKAHEWWKRNGRRYREMHNLRKKTLGWRKEQYRQVAAELAGFGRPIGVEMIDLRAFAETKDADNKLGNTARSNRFLVSPSELLHVIKNAAQKAGVPVIEVNAKYTSKTCSDCGEVNMQLGVEPEWTCFKCGAVHDRDQNAAVNIARRALEELVGKKSA